MSNHELRTPLTALLGSLRLLQAAAGNGDRLLRLLNDLLDLDRLEAGAMPLTTRDLELDGILAADVDLHREYARPFGVTLRPRLQGATIALESRPEGTWVRISVKDQGPGIPEAFRDRIFRKFEQEEGTRAHRPGGTGLGLAVAKLLVERMGGTIGFETAEGLGTTFSFTLPTGPDPAPPA